MRAILACAACGWVGLPALPGDGLVYDRAGGRGTLLTCAHVTREPDPKPCQGVVLGGVSTVGLAIRAMSERGMDGYAQDDARLLWQLRNLREADLWAEPEAGDL